MSIPYTSEDFTTPRAGGGGDATQSVGGGGNATQTARADGPAEPQAEPAAATVYSIDDARVHPAATWVAMGAPHTPNASQLAALLAASQVHVERGVRPTRLNASCTYLEVRMRANSVAVVAFETDTH